MVVGCIYQNFFLLIFLPFLFCEYIKNVYVVTVMLRLFYVIWNSFRSFGTFFRFCFFLLFSTFFGNFSIPSLSSPSFNYMYFILPGSSIHVVRYTHTHTRSRSYIHFYFQFFYLEVVFFHHKPTLIYLPNYLCCTALYQIMDFLSFVSLFSYEFGGNMNIA